MNTERIKDVIKALGDYLDTVDLSPIERHTIESQLLTLRDLAAAA
ncbi:hypothetical protein ACE1BS_13505 [Aeromonas jandaei]